MLHSSMLFTAHHVYISGMTINYIVRNFVAILKCRWRVKKNFVDPTTTTRIILILGTLIRLIFNSQMPFQFWYCKYAVLNWAPLEDIRIEFVDSNSTFEFSLQEKTFFTPYLNNNPCFQKRDKNELLIKFIVFLIHIFTNVLKIA